MKRILSIWLPDFAMERFTAAARKTDPPPPCDGPDEASSLTWPLALVEIGARGVRLAALNPAARAGGLRAGQMLADARAICPALVTHPAAPIEDRAMLDRLGHWAGRYSPLVARDGADGLLIDITGCAHLFGGEAALVADLTRRLQVIGFTARCAIAGTRGAAWGLARYDGQTEGEITRLPVEALRLAPDVAHLLRRLGLKTIGHLTTLPRPALERRFRSRADSAAVLKRLDQMFGAVKDPLVPLDPRPDFRAQLSFPEPVLEGPAIEAGLERLLPRLTARLERESRDARHFVLTAFHADGGTSEAGVRLARPGRQAGHIRYLFGEHLAVIDPGFGIDALALAAHETECIQPAQAALDGGADGGAEVSALVDRLVNRLGPRAVRRIAPRMSHIPERAQRPIAPASPAVWPDPTEHRSARPFRLLARPEAIEAIAEVPDGPPRRFVWRRVARQVVRARGPERIAPEWWADNGSDEVRDYYDVEDSAGHRYWIFRAGLYQDPARRGPPRWFLHGLFA